MSTTRSGVPPREPAPPDVDPGEVVGQPSPAPASGPEREDAAAAQNLAVVVNPARVSDLEDTKARLAEASRAQPGMSVRWYETTEDDPGAGQTEQALQDGATLVCSYGGDGTVRNVASKLIDTGVPLGLLPAGTGNLLARNLEVPVDDLGAAIETVLNGRSRAVDVGAVTWDDDPEQVFLVMAGMGADGEMMKGADEQIKEVVGWPAYLLSGIKGLFDRGFSAQVTAEGQETGSRRARMVIVGNCGELTGGIVLLPEARLDDGLLDVAVAAPKGLVGWFQVLRGLIRRRHDGDAVRQIVGERIEITTSRAVEAELDGDAVGLRQHMSARALPGSLLVRVPAESE